MNAAGDSVEAVVVVEVPVVCCKLLLEKGLNLSILLLGDGEIH